MAMIDYIENEPETRERFVDNAYRQNSNIKNLSDFKDALFKSFDTENGKRASKFFNDTETKALFESDENKKRLRGNVSGKEFNRLFTQESLDELEIQRDLPKGKEIRPDQVNLISGGRQRITKQHRRGGKTIRSYNRGFRQWTPAEVRFISVRRKRKVTSHKIVSQYNDHFKQSQRSKSSIRTRLYRT